MNYSICTILGTCLIKAHCRHCKYIHTQMCKNSTTKLSNTSEIDVESKTLCLRFGGTGHHPCLLVLPDSLFKKVRLALKADELHPVERVRSTIELRVPKGSQ